MTSPLLRVCLVVDSLHIGGGERHVIDLARALDEEGHGVTVACSMGGPLEAHLTDTSVRVRPLLERPVKRTVSELYGDRVRQLIAEERFDLVHAHLYASEAAAALATGGSSIPFIVTEHTEGQWQGRREREMNAWVVRQAAHAIAVSVGIERRLVRDLGVDPHRVSLIPNTVLSWTESDRGLGPGSEVPGGAGLLVGVIGRLAPEKGHRIFLDAIARVAPLVPHAAFVIVGDGVLREELQAQAQRLGVDGRTHFLGEQVSARAVIARLDVLVVPSLSEGTPLVVLEGLSCGVPILATRAGGIPDQVRDGRDALLVPPGDAEALGDALLLLLRNPGSRERLREGAARRAGQHRYAGMLRQTLQIYRSACCQGAALTESSV